MISNLLQLNQLVGSSSIVMLKKSRLEKIIADRRKYIIDLENESEGNIILIALIESSGVPCLI